MSVCSRLGQHRGQHGEPYRPGVPGEECGLGVRCCKECRAEADKSMPAGLEEMEKAGV